MSTPLSQNSVSTKHKTGDENKAADARLPHERDESPDNRSTEPQKRVAQAARDIAEGQVDTDLGDRPEKNPKNNAPTRDSLSNKEVLPDGSSS